MSANSICSTDGQLSFIYIANPLTPAESRLTLHKPYDGSKSLAEYVGALEGEWAISVSGRVVPQDELALTYLAQNDCVVLAPVLMGGGGGGGKQILRLVALVALMVFAPMAAMAMGFTATTAGVVGLSTAGMFVSAAITVGGSMIINSVLPPPKPDMGSSGGGFNSSPTYGIDGPKNLSTRNIPVPVIYGEAWFAGNFIQTYVENSGDTQYLNMLLNFGEGPIEDITNIHINDQPVQNFAGVEIFKRLGTATQEVIPYFADIIKPVNRGITLKAGIWSVHTITNPIDRVRVDIVMPKGISYLDDDDGMEGTTTAFLAEIRETGGQWLPLTSSSRIRISGRSMSPLRKSYYSGHLDKSKRYELRFTHTEDDTGESKSNSITVTDINEIVFDDIQYKHTALLGLRIKLSDQLNGIPSVKALVKGRKVNVWDAVTGSFVEQWTDNPAWIVIDSMTNKRFGAGMRADRFKLDYFRQWAAYCEANGLKFNGAIDQKTNVWDAMAPVFKVGRASPIRAGTKFQLAIQNRRAPVQLFSMGNIKKDSFNVDWLPADERANEVTVTYFDKEDFGKQKTVTVHSQRARDRGEHPKPSEMTLYGVDNLTQATREATLAINMNILLKTVSFDAPLESIACTIGDVVAIQHDMPKWGTGGLLASGSTKTQLKLDRPVDFDAEGTYVAMVRHDKVVQWTSEIGTVLGNTVFLGFGFNVNSISRYRRLIHVASGRDIAVIEPVIDSFGRHGVRLESASNMKPGDTVQLVDTDVIETINVTRPAAGADKGLLTLNLASPLKVAPSEETPWAFGLKETVVGLYSIISISGDQDMWRKISAIEYSDQAYSDEVVEYKPQPIQTAPVLTNVTFNGFKERRALVGGQYRSEVEFTWSHTSPDYLYAEVHVSVNDEPWRLVGANASIFSTELTQGVLRVRLVPVNLQGFKPYFESVTEHSYEVVAGPPIQPPSPTGVRVNAYRNVLEVKWGDIDAWAANKNIYRYEVWAAPGENANVLDATLLGVTGNDHYPHVGLPADTAYTYWVRAVNILANNSKSGFAGGVSNKTLPADALSDLFPDGINANDLFPDGLSMEDLSGELQQDIDWRNGLEDISHIVSELATKIETVTDGNKMEVFHRKEAIAGVEAFVRQEVTTLVNQDGAVAQMLTELEARVNDDIVAQLTEEKQVRADADSALSASVTTLQAKVDNDITAAINTESIARATADSAIAAQVNTLSAKVDNDITAAITAEQVARANADSALSGQITTLSAKVSNDITAAVSSEATARADADSALTTQVNTAQSTANGKNKSYRQPTAPTAGLVAGDLWFDSDDGNKPYRYTGSAWVATEDTRIAANTAAINSEAVTRATADSALATKITTLETKVGNDIAAAITTEQTARVNADTALSNSITSLTSRVGTAESAITTEQTTRANADTAISGNVTNLTTRVGTAETTITTHASSINGLSGQYSVKINSNGHIVGFGLSSTPATGTTNTSAFSVVADKFQVVRPGTTNAVPVFAVDTVNSRVVLQNAIVGDLQSDNYIAGVSGWCIKK